MADYTRSQVGRAAAILTTAEVAGTALDLGITKDKRVTVDLSFTIGSLTDVDVHFYASMDGTTYDPITIAGTVLTETLGASAERCYIIPPLAGWKFFRVAVQGGGTVTSSSCSFTYRFDRQGSR